MHSRRELLNVMVHIIREKAMYVFIEKGTGQAPV